MRPQTGLPVRLRPRRQAPPRPDWLVIGTWTAGLVLSLAVWAGIAVAVLALLGRL